MANFRVNSPPVVLETVDEETIIVNLESGSYYDLGHVGSHVLVDLEAGADVDARGRPDRPALRDRGGRRGRGGAVA